MPKKYGKRKQTPDLHETELYDRVTKLESEILSELEYLNKKRNIKFDCVHCYEDLPAEYDPSRNYYDEFWKAYMTNVICIKRYQDYRDWIKKIQKKVINVEKTYLERKKIMEPIDSKRRKRNSENQLQQFECSECGKRYKDEESLNLHVNMKHQGDQIKLELKTQRIIQANIEEPNHSYIENSDSEKNYYEDDEE